MKFQCTQYGDDPGANQVSYSTDGGANWTYLYNVDGYDSGLLTKTAVISGTYANVRVRLFSTNWGDQRVQNGNAGGNQLYIYDINIT